VEIDQALGIIRTLADGIDPFTGEVYPPASPYQNPQTLKALFLAISALEKEQKRLRRQGDLPANAGRPWSEDEAGNLLESFDAGKTIEELSTLHGRTPGAIRARLMRMGKIQEVG
jgi:hypothetical protein